MQNWALVAMLAMQAAEPAAQGTGIPSLPSKGYVVDAANILDSSSLHVVDSLTRARARSKMPVYVLTVRSVEAHDSTDISFEGFSHAVFERWRKTRPGADRAALVILSVDDRRARIETGPAWGRDYDGAVQQVMADALEPALARGSIEQGVVMATYETTWALKPPVVSTWMRDALLAAGVVLAGLLVVTILRRTRRSAPPPAPEPRPAAAIDPKLRVSQRMQAIGEARARSEKAASSIAWLDTGEMPKLEETGETPQPPTDREED